VSRHSPLPPEVVAEIRSSPESCGAIARRLGIARQTVQKIKAGKIHNGSNRGTTSEATIRLVLEQPPDMSLADIAALVGVDKDTARKIRLGLRFANVAPEIPRMTLEESRRRCSNCVQWVQPHGTGREHRYGRCHLGIQEATETQTWARGCGAYAPAKELPEVQRSPRDREPSGDTP